jgi:hypothetical protein
MRRLRTLVRSGRGARTSRLGLPVATRVTPPRPSGLQLVRSPAALREAALDLGPGAPRRAFVAVGGRDPLVDRGTLDRLLEQWVATDTDVRSYDTPHVVSLDAARDISGWIFPRTAERPA